MLQPVVALNGRIVPQPDACLSIIDDGIVRGATVTERMRTFGHRPDRIAEHLDRLRRSLAATGIADPQIVTRLPPLIDQVVQHNARLIADWQDLAVVVFVTPGPNPSLSGQADVLDCPTVCIHTTLIPPPQWRTLATEGMHLMIPSIRQLPAESIDPRIKHRSRLHWFLADREVRQVDPHAVALLLDSRGFVTETSTGNLVAFDGQRILTPRPECVLGGISQRFVTRLAEAAGVDTVASDLTPDEILAAREVFLTSTGYCVLPATRLNGRRIGDGRPGPLTQRLLADWSANVGVDILAQQLRAAETADS